MDSRLVVCQLPAGAAIVVHFEDGGRTLAVGDVVDLDAVAVPAKGSRQAVTWADALGAHASQHFVPVAKPSAPLAAAEEE